MSSGSCAEAAAEEAANYLRSTPRVVTLDFSEVLLLWAADPKNGTADFSSLIQ